MAGVTAVLRGGRRLTDTQLSAALRPVLAVLHNARMFHSWLDAICPPVAWRVVHPKGGPSYTEYWLEKSPADVSSAERRPSLVQPPPSFPSRQRQQQTVAAAGAGTAASSVGVEADGVGVDADGARRPEHGTTAAQPPSSPAPAPTISDTAVERVEVGTGAAAAADSPFASSVSLTGPSNLLTSATATSPHPAPPTDCAQQPPQLAGPQLPSLNAGGGGGGPHLFGPPARQAAGEMGQEWGSAEAVGVGGAAAGAALTGGWVGGVHVVQGYEYIVSAEELYDY